MEADKAPISLTCRHCQTVNTFSSYTTEQLRTMLTRDGMIHGLCSKCGQPVSATTDERASIAKALGLSSWR